MDRIVMSEKNWKWDDDKSVISPEKNLIICNSMPYDWDVVLKSEIREWCRKNLKGEYRVNITGRTYFEYEEDLLLYQLTWL